MTTPSDGAREAARAALEQCRYTSSVDGRERLLPQHTINGCLPTIACALDAFALSTRAAQGEAVEPVAGDRRECVHVACESCGGCWWTDLPDDRCGCGMRVCQSCVDVFSHIGAEAHGKGQPHNEVRRLKRMSAPRVASEIGKSCVYLSDGTKVIIKRDGGSAWLEVVSQAKIGVASAAPRDAAKGEAVAELLERIGEIVGDGDGEACIGLGENGGFGLWLPEDGYAMDPESAKVPMGETVEEAIRLRLEKRDAAKGAK